MSIVQIILIAVAAAAALLLLAVAWQVARTRLIAAEAERNVPPIGTFIDVDRNRLHHIDQGEGAPLLFIHGLGAQLYQFHGPLFPAMGEGFRLVAVDRPGSGYSVRAPGAGGTLKEQALVMRRFIEAKGLGKPLVVGHSLGTAVALALALDHPEAVAGLALISAHTHHADVVPPGFEGLNLVSPLKRRLVAETVAVPASQKYAAQTLAYLFAPQAPPADYMTAGGGWLGLRPSHFYATATDFVDARRDHPAYLARLAELKMPVGILFGTADKVLDYERHGLAMRDRIAGLDLELLDGVGHMPQFADPARVAAFVKRMAAKTFPG